MAAHCLGSLSFTAIVRVGLIGIDHRTNLGRVNWACPESERGDRVLTRMRMRKASPPSPSSSSSSSLLFVACLVNIAPCASGEFSWACELSRPMSIMADPPTSVDGGSSGTGRANDWFLDNGNRLLRDRRSLLRVPLIPRHDAVRLPVGYNERRQRHRAARSLSSGIDDASNATNSSNLFEPVIGVMANVSYPSDSEGANVGDDGDATGESTAYIPFSFDGGANVTMDYIDAGVGSTTVYMDVRLCGCASSLLQVVDTEFYCPASSSYCTAWRSSRSREEYGVECIEYMNWAVPWSRNSWYYILFLFVLFGIFLLCSRAGHVSKQTYSSPAARWMYISPKLQCRICNSLPQHYLSNPPDDDDRMRSNIRYRDASRV